MLLITIFGAIQINERRFFGVRSSYHYYALLSENFIFMIMGRGGGAKLRGRICASHLAALGSNLGPTNFLIFISIVLFQECSFYSELEPPSPLKIFRKMLSLDSPLKQLFLVTGFSILISWCRKLKPYS